VVAAARRIAAEHGAERLSMRPLADALGVMPNALYTYFPDKAAILDAVLDDLLGDVKRPRRHLAPHEALVALMGAYRRLLLKQPGLIPLTVSRPMVGPNALRLREDMLALLRQRALDDEEVVRAFLALFAFTTGFVVFEAARTPGQRDASRRAAARRLYDALPEADFPSTKALTRHLARRPGDRDFTRGLEAVITGFVSAGVRPGRSPGRSA
jgi:TetR/AcrR family transcriptional regulator, tetracycline repressor protein